MDALRKLKYELTYYYRLIVPWTTRGVLDETLERVRDERCHLTNVINDYHEKLRTALAERDAENIARQKLESQRIAEHEAVRGLVTGMVGGLDETLNRFTEFLEQMPDYTPDQTERKKMFKSLTEEELRAQGQVEGRMP